MKSVSFIVLVFSLLFGVHAHAAGSKQTCKVALVQPHLVWGNVEANLLAFGKRVEQCKGADMIIFPELFASGCEMKKKDKAEALKSKNQIAEYYPRIIEKMKAWAAQAHALVMGSTIYSEDGKFYNRLIAAFPDGTCRYYDKHNCFKKGSFSPGSEQLVFQWKGHRFATYICYDLRFPEWSRNNDRYDTVIYIANWPDSRRDDWNNLLRERAIENKANVIAVNCAGKDLAGLMYAGDSAWLSPTGEVKEKCEPYKEDILIIDLR